MKNKIFFSILIMVLCLVVFGGVNACAATVDSGECGDSVRWRLDDEGTLIIYGTGEIEANEYYNYPWYYNKSDINTVTIEYGVTNIPMEAFYGCTNLKQVTIPDSVKDIDPYSFWQCTALTEVVVPDSVVGIGASAFGGCSGLTDITLPFVGFGRGGVGHDTTLFGWIFGEKQQSGCEGITQYYTDTISRTFYIPEKLSSVTITDEYIIKYGAFSGCSMIEHLTLPEGTTEICASAFANCSSIAEFIIPGSVTKIAASAFFGCSDLSRVYARDINSWMNIEFESAASNPMYYAYELHFSGNILSRLNIPEGTTKIGDYTFYNCASITEINLPESLTHIGDYAFANCASITEINLPGSLTHIGDYVFANCGMISNIYLPESLTYMGNYAFSGCTQLSVIELPDSIIEIGEAAFSYCEMLQNILLPDNLQTIGAYAFMGCYSLTEISIPASVTNIGEHAFNECSSLETLRINDLAKWCGINFGNENANPMYIDPMYGVDNVYIDGSEISELTIPDGVTSIGTYAFCGYNDISAVYIPKSVKSIGKGAFAECKQLELVRIADDSELDSIGINAFYNCSKLTNVIMPESVKSIEAYAFSWCGGLTVIDIPSGVTFIGEGAFQGCSKLKAIIIPDGVNTIYQYTFGGCHSLQEIQLPDGLETIEFNSFEKCSELKEIYLPYSVTDADYAFEYCYNTIVYAHTSLQEDFESCDIKEVKYYHAVNYVADTGYKSFETVFDGEDAILLGSFGCVYEYYVDGVSWDGKNITSDVDVDVITKYIVTYVGDYQGEDYVAYGTDAVLPEGKYSFTVDGAHWNGKSIMAPVTVNVSAYCNVVYVNDGEQIDTVSVMKGGDATLPVCSEIGYHFEFAVDGKVWDGKNVTEDVTVEVAKVKNRYTITYSGAYEGEHYVEHGSDALLPLCPRTGYHYRFTHDGKYWDGASVTGNLDIYVVEEINVYNVIYTGDYQEIVGVNHGDDVVLPVCPDAGKAYVFTSQGKPWDGRNIIGDTEVYVSKCFDGCDILAISDMHNLKVSGDVIYCNSYYARISDIQATVSEGAVCKLYRDSDCTIEADVINLDKDGTEQIFYARVVAQSGRSRIYTVTASREYISNLGDIEYTTSSGGFVTLKLINPVPGDPIMSVSYAGSDGIWETKTDIRYDKATGYVYIDGLAEGTKYWMKVMAFYGDHPHAQSMQIELTTTELLSSECEIISVEQPPNAKLDKTAKTIYAKVENKRDSYEVQVTVSKGATWAVYYRPTNNIPIADNTITLREGRDTVVYIKVVAEDGYTTGVYELTIYRQRKSAQPEVKYVDGYVCIDAPEGSTILYTTDNKEPKPGFHGTVYTEPFKAAEGTVIKVIALNPGVEEYSDVLIYHAKAQYQTFVDLLYFDPVSSGYEWSVYLSTDNPAGIYGKLIIASYTSDGRLIDIYSEDVNSAVTECEMHGDFITDGADYCKIMLWGTSGNLKPLARVQMAESEQ